MPTRRLVALPPGGTYTWSKEAQRPSVPHSLFTAGHFYPYLRSTMTGSFSLTSEGLRYGVILEESFIPNIALQPQHFSTFLSSPFIDTYLTNLNHSFQPAEKETKKKWIDSISLCATS